MRCLLSAAALFMSAAAVLAQGLPPQQLSVLQAEDRRAPTAADVTRIQTQARSTNTQTAIVALRALGRLERPALITSITPAIRHRFPEVRIEAANAAAQAAEGWRQGLTAPGEMAPAVLLGTMADRLTAEEEPPVRLALAQGIGRLPYRTAAEVARAEAALVALASRGAAADDRLGAAKGLEALARLSGSLAPLSNAAIEALAAMLRADPSRDARVRRLSLEALAASGAADAAIVAHALADPDAQVRRRALAAATGQAGALPLLLAATDDPSPLVRLQALEGFRSQEDDRVCPMAIAMTADPDVHVALAAIDGLRACGGWSSAVSLLDHHASALPRADRYRQWHRTARAIVALAGAAPDLARERLEPLARARTWQIRLYAARAAAALGDVATLERLAADPDDNVVEAAIFGLTARVGHAVGDVYLAALGRQGTQAVRAAAVALNGSPHPGARAALLATLERMAEAPGSGALEARRAVVDALRGIGEKAQMQGAPLVPANAGLTAAGLRGLSAPRARVTVREVGVFELALVVGEAPGTVVRFIELAESGYYEGTTFHGLVPDVAVHGGSPGASEYVGHPHPMRDEVGLWPHVRGAVGLSARGRDTGDGRFFINLADNPRFDHQFTVFAHVLNGMDVVDRLLEGDVIERIDILR